MGKTAQLNISIKKPKIMQQKVSWWLEVKEKYSVHIAVSENE